MSERRRHLDIFYSILSQMKDSNGGFNLLYTAKPSDFPKQGVYFFFEVDERIESSGMLKVVRVGTHAVSPVSKTTLWNRLAKHKGHADKRGGNHRESIFRNLVGDAMLQFGAYSDNISKSWNKKINNDFVRVMEKPLEDDVSYYISKMPFLYLNVPDSRNGRSSRAFIEKNAIALLSNRNKHVIYGASDDWLGMHSTRPQVRESGLWNIRNVDIDYDSNFLTVMRRYL